MKDFAELIHMAKAGDENAMLELIYGFMPVIVKYTRIMNYDDDFKSEMILRFIQFIKIDFKLEKLIKINDFAILKYINKTLHISHIWRSLKNIIYQLSI